LIVLVNVMDHTLKIPVRFVTEMALHARRDIATELLIVLVTAMDPLLQIHVIFVAETVQLVQLVDFVLTVLLIVPVNVMVLRPWTIVTYVGVMAYPVLLLLLLLLLLLQIWMHLASVCQHAILLLHQDVLVIQVVCREETAVRM
jgi:hypothetical protein